MPAAERKWSLVAGGRLNEGSLSTHGYHQVSTSEITTQLTLGGDFPVRT